MDKITDLDDYQDLYRSFIGLNRHAKELLQINRIMHPKKFDEKVEDLIAGRKQFNDDFVFNQLRSNYHLSERQVKD